jgi:hypothetical protein
MGERRLFVRSLRDRRSVGAEEVVRCERKRESEREAVPREVSRGEFRDTKGSVGLLEYTRQTSVP